MANVAIGVIGGSGLYDPAMIGDVLSEAVETKYGSPSDRYNIGKVFGRSVAFLSRHGPKHLIPPHELNFKANISGFEQLGARRIISCCAVGSLQESYKPGDVVIPDQFIDWRKRMDTFYNTGDVTHVSLADPFCPQIREILINACKDLGVRFHSKGTYVCVEGPRFSTRAESRMFRTFGDIIGMTGVPEAILAREREMCLGIVATVTDYDSFSEKPVSMEDIASVMKTNAENVKNIVMEALRNMPEERSCSCKEALKGAKA